MSTYKPMKNRLHFKHPRRHIKRLSLDDMVGKYKAIEPINCVELKHKLK